METEAIDNQANLVNYDNENEYEIEDLGYESEGVILRKNLAVDQGTRAMKLVLGKEKGGYAREVGSGVTCKSEQRRERNINQIIVSKDVTRQRTGD
ncbi:hypothetical protein Tco_0804198 [Tanacetum coccineum]|uniref:Uncharacterized protein n=1 Tax=Tanacetum coccineum TaxID=301880 RepID=A0ABQ5A3N6_9ASTR